MSNNSARTGPSLPMEVPNLKMLIQDQLHALFGPWFFPTASFDVVTSRYWVRGTTNHHIVCRAIVYTQPFSFEEWQVLEVGGVASTLPHAMASLYMKLLDRANARFGDLGVGWTYTRGGRIAPIPNLSPIDDPGNA